HGARFGERGGCVLASAYTDPAGELVAARAGVAAADVSGFAKFSLLGPWAAAFPQAAGKPRTVARPFDAPGPLACRLSDDHLLLLAESPAAAPEGWLAGLPEGVRLLRQDVSSAYADFWLFGPRVPELLCRLTALDLDAALPEGACAEAGLAAVPAILV